MKAGLGSTRIEARIFSSLSGRGRAVRWESVAFWHGRWPGYAFALAASAVAATLCSAFAPILGDRGPFIFFFPVIAASAGIGGVGPALAAVILSTAFGYSLSVVGGLQFAAVFPVSGLGVVALAALLSRWRTREIASEGALVAGEAERVANELALLIDGATNHAIYMLDTAGRVTIWNEGAERIKGWSECEILGQHFSIFYPQHEIRAGKPELDLAHATAVGRVEEESWRIRKDGTEFLASVTITALLDRNDRLVGFGKVIRDVTDQRAAEAVIEAREGQLRSILATIPDGMIVIDDSGVITSFSATAERLFGWDEAEVVGQKIEVLMPQPDRDRHDAYLSRYLATGEQHIIGTTRRVIGARKDGSTFPLELSIGEAKGVSERVFTGFIRDLSASEAAAEEMRGLQSDLSHVSRLSAMGTMASTLAHELNQPIAAVANYVEASRDLLEAPNEETAALLREALDEAASEAFRAGNIIRRLRAFVARGEVEKGIERLAALIEEATILGLAGATERGVAATITIADDVGMVLVDRVQIQQVLVNLMRNAIEAMAPGGGGVLSINASKAGSLTHFVVADSGPGLDPDVTDRLFEAFATTKRQGMGLGLSICRTIVEAHGGHIWATPRDGGGSEFHFTLPTADMEEDQDGR